MKIVDIITDSALLLGLNEEVAILKTVTEDTEPEILRENISICKLFNLVQQTIKEFCTNYVPIVEERTLIVEVDCVPVPLKWLTSIANTTFAPIFKPTPPLKTQKTRKNKLFA